MGLADNLNFLTTIGTFGCISFALSGFGVKLGKFSSYPHQLGFSYISEKTDKDKRDKLYDAIAKTNANNKEDNVNIPDWAKKKDELEAWCKANEKSPMKWKDASQYCLVKPTVWHHLILNDVKINEVAEAATVSVLVSEASSPTKAEEKCTYKLLNMYADSENHVDYLIGKRACATKVNTPQSPVVAGGGPSTSTQST